MNERIQELAEQAGLGQERWTTTEQFNSFLDKFGELIVAECVGVVEGGRFLHPQAPTAIFAKECSAAIKRHFGVTE
jgi:hypothetical protein